MSKDTGIPDNASASLEQLKVAAKELNLVSDELGKPVAALDRALKELNLGVAAWTVIGEWGESDGSYLRHDLGYAKVGSKWGIALRACEGNEYHDSGDERVEDWLFADAPRRMRIEAIDHLPKLLEALTRQANETAKEIGGKVDRAKQVVAAITGPTTPQRRK